jgi:hypothetical protein
MYICDTTPHLTIAHRIRMNSTSPHRVPHCRSSHTSWTVITPIHARSEAGSASHDGTTDPLEVPPKVTAAGTRCTTQVVVTQNGMLDSSVGVRTVCGTRTPRIARVPTARTRTRIRRNGFGTRSRNSWDRSVARVSTQVNTHRRWYDVSSNQVRNCPDPRLPQHRTPHINQRHPRRNSPDPKRFACKRSRCPHHEFRRRPARPRNQKRRWYRRHSRQRDPRPSKWGPRPRPRRHPWQTRRL